MTTLRVAVLGLGYVGIPLVGACIKAGHSVLGFDTDDRVVANLNGGLSHVDDVASVEISSWVSQGFIATSDASTLTDIDVFIICVPTPLSDDGSPDLSAVRAASLTVAAQLDAARKPLVVLESTTYPGTTEEIVKPILESRGAIAKADFCLAFSPERIDPGNKEWDFQNTPKIVGGLTESCTDRAVEFYLTVTTEVVRTKGLKEAEMAKLLENTYRHVNIALVNELAKISHLLDIDFWDVIAAAETKPYGFQAFRPGPGVGGHCIPIDPNYLGHRVRTELGQSVRFVELAQEINASMPAYVVHRTEQLLRSDGKSLAGADILLLGVTYKANIGDQRESPAFGVARELRKAGAQVRFHDPLVESWIVDEESVPKMHDLASASAQATCSILLQAHDCYREPTALLGARLLLNTQGHIQLLSAGEGTNWMNL
ncbi:MAG: nucleotide sugar dehydrogenase [Actinomycetota bacterium]|nr:nucleotide sugar dehydrogenase [Actinomycetota bacterium]